jgi:hypothetical protein
VTGSGKDGAVKNACPCFSLLRPLHNELCALTYRRSRSYKGIQGSCVCTG